MKINKTFLLKRILPVAAGAGLGFAYYYFIGCSSGGCAITSNPYISTAYGAALGLILAFPTKKKLPKENDDERA
ncbi:MAG: hypothetical protein GXO87_03250 [Chlorobi bacterium]|nr:hypothetical protein [Chlorobiota bacterium]